LSGDGGRTIFMPDRKEEVAGLLFDPFVKIALLGGDQQFHHPAHGSGSVCWRQAWQLVNLQHWFTNVAIIPRFAD